ncbi:hypothetical protein E1B28_005379 [Marasmius oreades]|uniref:Uncharacterized protein n=1 Tax=Marasmius oreades TaxID=181124 RepID=A0A9P7S4F3_9AGAR|nr:uncharacterized protein E1B28_005379 [Marasmius oreades]KAG7094551.1 hypothetical protein E1B28_005379 [Marasmius oreades]
MSGLAPTMVIARVAYGKSVESVQQAISSLHIANANSQATQQRSTTGRQQGTNEFQLQSQHEIAVNDLVLEETSAIPVVVDKV